ncbi:hypothetical protein [Corynebacterium pygosceleis]|uniref:Uncharacterized protein n=1 Tax=Corynebacterium pygosceleis TaxID=2800406 RepID=A0A9Q4C9K1_9CORY|nr:hypothetical protein [Corynebacterium pygosceleis]MCK7637701.1 hypothetical protein [Corynebacterium pygosceleis]MCK7674892.1 hypothetical protein [Corynebacterium pygosceleis]MCL0119519.1 hypothetical protein [Corynebacterium pygosceleis]MCX7444759.1 hypothetical protein [Corynebacterium pygosceleis]MCX7467970.1 hypothetical protein [Corynebacterium pygosceleis]
MDSVGVGEGSVVSTVVVVDDEGEGPGSAVVVEDVGVVSVESVDWPGDVSGAAGGVPGSG